MKKYCDDKSLLFSEIDYDAFVTNITDQNLKDETNRIKNYCGISTSVNPETFKKMLSNYISEDMVIYSELEDCIFKN
jgi:hypothetical protein